MSGEIGIGIIIEDGREVIECLDIGYWNANANLRGHLQICLRPHYPYYKLPATCQSIMHLMEDHAYTLGVALEKIMKGSKSRVLRFMRSLIGVVLEEVQSRCHRASYQA